MQIIHPYRDGYPFGLDKQTELTYVQLLRENLSEQQIRQYKLKNKLYREMAQTHLVKLVKIFRENANLRFLYEYYPLSIEKCLADLSIRYNNKVEVLICKRLLTHFISSIDHIVEILVHYQIKKELALQNLVVSQSNDDLPQLKLFIEPETQCLALNLRFSQQNHNQLKQIIQKNRQFLQQFYDNEKKKLIVQFQELLEKTFGKIQQIEATHPNFVINGSKLVFIHNNVLKKIDKQHKSSISVDKADLMTNSGHRGQKGNKFESKNSQKKQLKQRNSQRIKQIKNTLSRLEHKNQEPHHIDDYEEENRKEHNEVDQIHFKPEEITNDKTAIIEEKQYLRNLEEQLQHMNHNKLKKQHMKQGQVRGGSPCAKDLRLNAKIFSQMKPQFVKTTDSLGQNQQKVHRYKMKIITSHDIQIQEAGDPNTMDMQKQIYEGIRSCKFNINNVSNIAIEPQSQGRKSEKRYQRPMEAAECREVQARSSDFGMRPKRPHNSNQKKAVISAINPGQKYNDYENNQQYDYDHLNNNKEHRLSQKQSSAQNYYDKIKSAKSKAQKILKQYARVKKQ